MQTSFAEDPDALWERVERWIPKRTKSPKGGRPRVSDRRAMSGILYRLRTGCQWDATPSEFGSRGTCYRRDRESAVGLGLARQRLGDGSQRGELTGPNPTALVHMACALIAYGRGNAEKRTPVLLVAVNVALAVGAPVMVAALLNGSEIVKVIDAARRSRIDGSFVGMATMRSSNSTPDRRTASITFTMSFQLTSAATITGAPTARATLTATIRAGGPASRGRRAWPLERKDQAD